MLNRAYRICSNYNILHLEFSFLRTYFYNNGFSYKLIDSYINKFLRSKLEFGNSDIQIGPKKEVVYFTIPYFGYQSEKLKTELSSLLNKYFIEKDFRIIGINNNKLGSFFHFKDRLPKGMQSSLVYKFSCLHCKSEYIGCLLYTSPSPRDKRQSRMPSSA